MRHQAWQAPDLLAAGGGGLASGDGLRGLVAEAARGLQAGEVGGELRIYRLAVGLEHRVQERIRSDGSVAGIGHGRADQPDRSAIGASLVELELRAAAIGLEVVV